jgi:hypothetical protein
MLNNIPAYSLNTEPMGGTKKDISNEKDFPKTFYGKVNKNSLLKSCMLLYCTIYGMFY